LGVPVQSLHCTNSQEPLFSYAKSNPIRFIDFNGLATYDGLTDEEHEAIRLAIHDALRKIKECDFDCKEKGFDQSDIDKLTYEMTHANYKKTNSGVACASSDWIKNNDILIDEFSVTSSSCCSLAATVAHEAGHLALWSNNSIIQLQKDCFGCNIPNRH